MACSACTRGPKKMGAMTTDKQKMKKCLDQIQTSLAKELARDVEAEKDVYVFRIKGGGFGGHMSVVLSTDCKRFVTIELDFDGAGNIRPFSRSLHVDPSKFEFCGKIKDSVTSLANQAVTTMMKFGSYSKILNSCQDYCNEYLKDIGLPNQIKLTDGDKALFGGLGIFAVGAAVLAGFAVAGSGNRQQRH